MIELLSGINRYQNLNILSAIAYIDFLDSFSPYGVSFRIKPRLIRFFIYCEHTLVVSPILVAISDIRELPIATAVIIALYTAGSRTSCFNRFSGSSNIADAGLRNTFFILSSTLMLSFICKRYCGVPPTIPYIRAISSAENPLKYLQLSSKSNGSIFIWAVLLPYKGALYASTLSSM